MRFQGVRRNPFARNEVRSPKTEVKLRFQGVRRNPFARNEVRSSKTEVKDGKSASSSRPAQPFRTKRGFCVEGAALGALQAVGCTPWQVSIALPVAVAWQVLRWVLRDEAE